MLTIGIHILISKVSSVIGWFENNSLTISSWAEFIANSVAIFAALYAWRYFRRYLKKRKFYSGLYTLYLHCLRTDYGPFQDIKFIYKCSLLVNEDYTVSGIIEKIAEKTKDTSEYTDCIKENATDVRGQFYETKQFRIPKDRLVLNFIENNSIRKPLAQIDLLNLGNGDFHGEYYSTASNASGAAHMIPVTKKYFNINEYQNRLLSLLRVGLNRAEHWRFIVAYHQSKNLYKKIDPNSLEFLKKIAILVEDKNFLKHKGYRIKSIIRAIISQILCGKLGYLRSGGSSITMQLVRTLCLDFQQPIIKRKIGEIILAKKFEEILSKEEIIMMYLVSVRIADKIFGVQSIENSILMNLTQSQCLAIVYSISLVKFESDSEKQMDRLKYYVNYLNNNGFDINFAETFNYLKKLNSL